MTDMAMAPANAGDVKRVELIGVLCVALICAVFTGFVSHEGWPGSVLAVIGAFPLGLLVWRQAGQRRTAFSLACTAATVIALASMAWAPDLLNISLFWAGLAALAIASADPELKTLSGLTEQVARNAFCFPRRMRGDASVFRKETTLVWRGMRTMMLIANLVLPVLAVVVFGTLLAIANPIIADFLVSMPTSDLLIYVFSRSLPATMLTFLALWIAMRATPRITRLDDLADWAEPNLHRRFIRIGPAVTTLVLLNLMFAFENALDIHYIWQGIQPTDIYATRDTVHRGAYTLIATALRAGVLIVVMLHAGTETEKSSAVRVLVYLFTAQNVLLVASSAKRLMFYIDNYGMTLLRLSSLIWMGLVAFGLVLIAIKVFRNKSNLWLLNANLAAAVLVLLASAPLDYRAFVANWEASTIQNKIAAHQPVGHVDLNYIGSLGPSAAPAVSRIVEVYKKNAAGVTALSRAPQYLPMLEQERKQSQLSWQSWTLRYAMIDQ
jgi:hypothetical protein